MSYRESTPSGSVVELVAAAIWEAGANASTCKYELASEDAKIIVRQKAKAALTALRTKPDTPQVDKLEAALREKLFAAIKHTPELTVNIIRQENYSGEHREWNEPVTFPKNAKFYEVVLQAIFDAAALGGHHE